MLFFTNRNLAFNNLESFPSTVDENSLLNL